MENESGHPTPRQREGSPGQQNTVTTDYNTPAAPLAPLTRALDRLLDAAADAAVLAVELADLAHQKDDGALTVRALAAGRLAVEVYAVWDLLDRAATLAAERGVQP